MLGYLRQRWATNTQDSVRSDLAADQVEHAWNHLSLVSDWVKHAEAKLGVVLAFVGVLAAALVTLTAEIAAEPKAISCLMLLLVGGAAILLLASSICAAKGLLPKFRAQGDITRANLLFYGDVAHYHRGDEKEYTGQLASLLGEPSQLTEQIARQAHANSLVAARKYLWANRSIFTGLIALLLVMAVGAGHALSW